MDRHYKDIDSADDVVYFVGPEVEKTSLFGQLTLFKVGERPLNEILDRLEYAEGVMNTHINHIYFTANHSIEQIKDWSVVEKLLTLGYYVTVDGFYDQVQKIEDQLPLDHPKLIIMLSVPIVDVDKYGKETYIKVDDSDFQHSNKGVWLHKLEDLTKEENFTPWKEYKADTILAVESDVK